VISNYPIKELKSSSCSLTTQSVHKFLSKKVKIRIHKIIILPVVLMGGKFGL
jgi:hypothetical protein